METCLMRANADVDATSTVDVTSNVDILQNLATAVGMKEGAIQDLLHDGAITGIEEGGVNILENMREMVKIQRGAVKVDTDINFGGLLIVVISVVFGIMLFLIAISLICIIKNYLRNKDTVSEESRKDHGYDTCKINFSFYSSIILISTLIITSGTMTWFLIKQNQTINHLSEQLRFTSNALKMSSDLIAKINGKKPSKVLPETSCDDSLKSTESLRDSTRLENIERNLTIHNMYNKKLEAEVIRVKSTIEVLNKMNFTHMSRQLDLNTNSIIRRVRTGDPSSRFNQKYFVKWDDEVLGGRWIECSIESKADKDMWEVTAHNGEKGIYSGKLISQLGVQAGYKDKVVLSK